MSCCSFPNHLGKSQTSGNSGRSESGLIMDKLEAYSYFCQTSMMEIFAERVNGFSPFPFLRFIVNALQGSE